MVRYIRVCLGTLAGAKKTMLDEVMKHWGTPNLQLYKRVCRFWLNFWVKCSVKLTCMYPFLVQGATSCLGTSAVYPALHILG